MLNLILFGPPGSGKGTQSEKIIEKYGLVHLSTGDLLRNERKLKTPLGIAAQEYIDKGQLVPDEVVIGMIETAIDANKDVKGFLFDGFPRTVAQAIALGALLDKKDTSIAAVLFLQVEEEELIARLLNRGKTSGRSDDTDESILRNRQKVYKEETLPVADYYTHLNKVTRVEGTGSIDDIFNRLCSNIDQYDEVIG